MDRDNTAGRKTILIYSAGRETTGRRFKKEVERVIPEAIKDVCRTVGAVRQTLIEHMGTYKIVVLLCATQEEMSFFSLIRELFCQSRLILIIPNHRMETIRQAHKFYPRFLSYLDASFEVVAAVIQRSAILEYAAQNEVGQKDTHVFSSDSTQTASQNTKLRLAHSRQGKKFSELEKRSGD